MNYYSFVHNYSKMVGLLNIILKTSCAKLLAAKFSMRSTARVFAKFGKNLAVGNTKFLTPEYKTDNMRFLTSASPIVQTQYASLLSTANLENIVCSKCKSDHRVEIHHVKWMKDLNPRISGIDRMVVRANRKQIPLCRSCHIKLHRASQGKAKL